MGRLDVVRALVASGAAVEQLTASGLTPLSMAEAAGYTDIVDFLNSRHDADARAGSGEQPDSV